MKKILCLLLTLVLVFACASCDKFKGDDTTNDDSANNSTNDNGNNDNNGNSGDDGNAPQDPFAAFENAIVNSDPSTIIVDVVTVTALGELDSHFEIFFNENGSLRIEYTYERFYGIGEGPEGEDTYETTVTLYRDKDGNYSENIGIDLGGIEPAAAFNISSFKSSATINEIGDELTVTIPKTNTLELLGAQFDSDVQLTVAICDGALERIVLASSTKTITYNYQ